MTNRVRWHTPPTRPAHKAKDQENVPAGVLALYPQFSEKLDALERLLQKHGNPTSTPLGQADDFQLWAQYDREYPGQLTPKMQTPRYSYFLMAQLATADDVKAWLEEWRHAGLDLGPFAKTSFFASPNLAQQLPPHACGFHAHLDETLPNGTVRHLHDTQVAANSDPTGAARIVLGDPYLGSGLDPTRLSGVVAPYRSTLEPYMACCGQPIGSKQNKNAIPPGCWIQMDPRRPAGQLVPYTLWFSSNGEADILNTWQSAIENRLVDRIRNRVQTGTAFIQEEYYANLDRQIRALLVAPGLATAIEAVHANVFNANFAGDGPWAQLSETHREELRMLVALVDRYNAPQLGACHRELKRSDSELEALIFRPLEGRMLWLEKKLVKVVKINGRDIAILSVDNFETSVIKLIANLQAVGLGTAAKTLQDTARLVVIATEQQQFVEEQKRATDQELPTLRSAALRIGIPNLLAPKFLYQTGLYEEAEKLKTELIGLLNTLAKETNDWLRTEAKTPLVLSNQDRFRNIASDMQVYGQALRTVAAQFKQFTVILNGFNPTQDELRAVLSDDQKPYLALPEVLTWARLRFLIEKFPDAQKAMVISNPDRVSIQDAARQAIAYTKEEASARAAAAATEAAKRTAREEAERRASSSMDRRELVLTAVRRISDAIVPAENTPLLRPAYKYDNFSCTFDTVFAALFMIPNQWFRRQIAKAKTLYVLPRCSDAEALEVDAHIIQVIEYMEKQRASPIVCPLMSWWNKRMLEVPEPVEAVGEGRIGIAYEMVGALAKFYGIADQIAKVTANDAKRLMAPPFVVKDSERFDMLLIDIPVQFEEKNTFESVPVTTEDDLFTLVACIVHSSSERHFEICIRDPRQEQWYRYDKDGKANELSKGDKPKDILGESVKFGKLPTDYKYWPNLYFYVRTEELSRLLPTLNLGEKDLSTFSQKDRVSLARIFGYRATPGTGEYRFPTSYVELNENLADGTQRRLGLMQVFQVYADSAQVTPWDDRESYFIYSSLLDPQKNIRFSYVSGLVLPVLRKMFNTRRIGTYHISDDDFIAFQPVASKVHMLKDGYWIPNWATGDVHLKAPDGYDEQFSFKKLADAWSQALFVFLAYLQNKVPPNMLLDPHVVEKEWKLMRK